MLEVITGSVYTYSNTTLHRTASSWEAFDSAQTLAKAQFRTKLPTFGTTFLSQLKTPRSAFKRNLKSYLVSLNNK